MPKRSARLLLNASQSPIRLRHPRRRQQDPPPSAAVFSEPQPSSAPDSMHSASCHPHHHMSSSVRRLQGIRASYTTLVSMLSLLFRNRSPLPLCLLGWCQYIPLRQPHDQSPEPTILRRKASHSEPTRLSVFLWSVARSNNIFDDLIAVRGLGDFRICAQAADNCHAC